MRSASTKCFFHTWRSSRATLHWAKKIPTFHWTKHRFGHRSTARSISVLNYFKDEKGFDPELLSQEGFGEYKPIAANDTAEGRAKNRRVEVKIMSQYNENSDEFDEYSDVSSTTNIENNGSNPLNQTDSSANSDDVNGNTTDDINQIVTDNLLPSY